MNNNSAMKDISPESIYSKDSRLFEFGIDVFQTLETLEETLHQAIIREENNQELLVRIEGDLKRATFHAEFGLSTRIKAEAADEIKLLRRVRRNTLAEQKKLNEWMDAMFEYRDLLYKSVPLN